MSSNGMVRLLSEGNVFGCEWCIRVDSEPSLSRLTGSAGMEGGFDYLWDCSVGLRRGRDGGRGGGGWRRQKRVEETEGGGRGRIRWR